MSDFDYTDDTDADLLTYARNLADEVAKLWTMSRWLRRDADDYTSELRARGEAIIEAAAAREPSTDASTAESVAATALASLEDALR